MADIVLEGKQMKLDDTATVTPDEALGALDEVMEILVRRIPGFTNGATLLMYKAAVETIHWIYKSTEHPKPAELIKKIVDEAMAEVRGTLYVGQNGGKKELVQ